MSATGVAAKEQTESPFPNGRLRLMETRLHGLSLIVRQPIGDSRGYFERVFCAHELRTVLSGKKILQINQSYTANRGAVRGLHFQRPPFCEMKIVSCLRGEVFDVAVDLRKHSPTYLQWHAELLSESNRRSLLIPEGFAHGFQALTAACELLYFTTAPYEPTSEGGLNVRDPLLDIAWPLPIEALSPRDQAHSFLDATFDGLVL